MCIHSMRSFGAESSHNVNNLFLLVAKDIYELTATTQTPNCLWKITQTSISWAMQIHVNAPGISTPPTINSKMFLGIWYASV